MGFDDVGIDGAPIDTVLLRTFLEVVRRGSFVVAAESLALTPSAVSGHIKRLESTVGVDVLVRTTRTLKLTPQGELLFSYARNIVDLDREVRAKLRGAPLRGLVRVGASEDFAGTWLPQVLQRFRRCNPDAAIELKVGITSELLRLQDDGRLDLVFGKQCGLVDVGGDLLWEEPLHWAFSDLESIDTNQPLPLAVFPEPCVYRTSAITALGESGREWRLAFESSSMAGCLSAARSGFAVTVIAESQRAQGLRLLSSIDGVPALPSVRFYAFPRTASPATSALIDSARSEAQISRFRGSGPQAL